MASKAAKPGFIEPEGFDEEAFIESVKQHPSLYDKTDDGYKNQDKTEAAWRILRTIHHFRSSKYSNNARRNIKSCFDRAVTPSSSSFYTVVMNSFTFSVDDTKAKWRVLRDRLNRLKKRRDAACKSGAGGSDAILIVAEYEFMRRMGFLVPHLKFKNL